MSVIMKGAEVASAIQEQLRCGVEQLKKSGINPQLGIVRVGARPDDLAYERGAIKNMEKAGIAFRVFEFPEAISQSEFEREFSGINSDPSVHGILLFRPLPKHLDEETFKRIINPLKDVDCMSPVNIAKVFSGDETGFAPCTPEAVMKTLIHYGIELKGKRITVIGRSMVVGKPLAMMLLKKDATVTLCHTKTKNLMETCCNAEILIAAAGKAKMVTRHLVGDQAVVADVGINVDEEGRLCGDVNFDEVSEIASYITPVPGGIGTVTSSVLAEHVVRAAKCLNDIE